MLLNQSFGLCDLPRIFAVSLLGKIINIEDTKVELSLTLQIYLNEQ